MLDALRRRRDSSPVGRSVSVGGASSPFERRVFDGVSQKRRASCFSSFLSSCLSSCYTRSNFHRVERPLVGRFHGLPQRARRRPPGGSAGLYAGPGVRLCQLCVVFRIAGCWFVASRVASRLLSVAATTRQRRRCVVNRARHGSHVVLWFAPRRPACASHPLICRWI